ncbi:MAG TPA: type II toxin-antitoxin system VapC family toxin [Acidimicrobiia bacterium]|nr:type II toxin-antitoxin system VapC family toxin [Acidimicrobiia bacterium]
MSLYVDTSALLKRYVAEHDSETFQSHLIDDPIWISGRHTEVETRRNLARLLEGRDLNRAQQSFREDWARTNIVELDAVLCGMAADLAEVTQARTLDALHLAAAQRVGGGALPLLTADLRQAQIARGLGWTVLGA